MSGETSGKNSPRWSRDRVKAAFNIIKAFKDANTDADENVDGALEVLTYLQESKYSTDKPEPKPRKPRTPRVVEVPATETAPEAAAGE